MTVRLFDRLKAANTTAWRAYTHHPFVEGLARGTLPEAAFRHYLQQDYIFLIHFARAYALAVYKAPDLAGMRSAAAVLNGLLETEMQLHVAYCKSWGINPASLERIEEAPENIAYTRFVLDCGMAGDILDLMVALSPCVIGYGEIGKRLMEEGADASGDNPYLPWIEMYAGEDYREVMITARDQLDHLAAKRMTEERFPELARIFGRATKLEASFWQMGLNTPKNAAADP